MLHFQFFFIMALFAGIAYGQEREITVRVIDEKTKKPVNKANIRVSDTTRGTTTNILGYFRLGLSPTEKELVISHVTYTTATIPVPEKLNTFTVELKTDVQLLPEIDLRDYPNDFVIEHSVKKNLRDFQPRPDSLIVIEANAGFPYEGGIQTFAHWFGNKFKFPERELMEREQGKILIVFTIDRNGDYQHIACPVDRASKLCEEFRRILTEMPKWTPGEQRGEPVEQSFAMFVNYGINEYWAKKIKEIRRQ